MEENLLLSSTALFFSFSFAFGLTAVEAAAFTNLTPAANFLLQTSTSQSFVALSTMHSRFGVGNRQKN